MRRGRVAWPWRARADPISSWRTAWGDPPAVRTALAWHVRRTRSRTPAGAAVSAAFVEACHGATGGNTLLIRRLAERLRERGVDGGGDVDAAAVTRLGPYAVAGAVGATLARLGDAPARLARAVAVLERRR